MLTPLEEQRILRLERAVIILASRTNPKVAGALPTEYKDKLENQLQLDLEGMSNEIPD